MSEYTPTTDNVRVSHGVAAGFPVMSVPERGRAFQRWLAAHSAPVRAAALDEAAEVAKAEGHKWHERGMDSDREESLVGRRYADYRDTALALASAIRALKEAKK